MIVLVVAVGVGARIFKNTMLSGATQANMSVKRMLFLGAVFGGIQVLMVSLGLALTWTIDNVWGMETVGGVYRMMALICLRPVCQCFISHRGSVVWILDWH